MGDIRKRHPEASAFEVQNGLQPEPVTIEQEEEVTFDVPELFSTPPMPEEGVPGRKDDSGKIDLTLLFDDCPHALEAVAEVLQWAVTKKQPKPYERGSWQGVEPFQERYRAAMLRHVLGAAKERLSNGLPIEQTTDHETGLLQLAHIATGALFQLEMAVRKIKGIA